MIRRWASILLVSVGLLGYLFVSSPVAEGLVRCVAGSGHQVIELAHPDGDCGDDPTHPERSLPASPVLSADCVDTPLTPVTGAAPDPQRTTMRDLPAPQPVAIHTAAPAGATWRRARLPHPAATGPGVVAVLRTTILLI